MNFWKDGLSIDESKISVLILSFIITIIFSLFVYYFRGDITTNLLSLLLYEITAIGGVNITDKISGFFNKSNNKNETNLESNPEPTQTTPTI